MYDVRELDGVANKEDRQVVTHQVPVAVFCIELHGKAARVSGRLCRVSPAYDGGEAHKEWGALAFLLEQLSAGVFSGRFCADGPICFKVAVCACATGMDHSLRDALAVEVGDLLDKLVVLE